MVRLQIKLSIFVTSATHIQTVEQQQKNNNIRKTVTVVIHTHTSCPEMSRCGPVRGRKLLERLQCECVGFNVPLDT